MPEHEGPFWRKMIWWLGWPVRSLLILLVRGYQKWISPSLPPSCRYYPSCSSYAVQSLERHGLLKGLLLASWRVLKCNPLTDGGVNPVPERGRWRASVLTTGKPRSKVARPADNNSGGGSGQTVPDSATTSPEHRSLTESTTGA